MMSFGPGWRRSSPPAGSPARQSPAGESVMLSRFARGMIPAWSFAAALPWLEHLLVSPLAPPLGLAPAAFHAPVPRQPRRRGARGRHRRRAWRLRSVRRNPADRRPHRRQHQWIGGTTVLMQTGDIFDRGPKVREALDLLMRLEEEARRAGGRVEALLGNHEVMNLLHEFRDVSPASYAAFADASRSLVVNARSTTTPSSSSSAQHPAKPHRGTPGWPATRQASSMRERSARAANTDAGCGRTRSSPPRARRSCAGSAPTWRRPSTTSTGRPRARSRPGTTPRR